MKHLLLVTLAASLGIAACSKNETPPVAAGSPHATMGAGQGTNSGKLAQVLQAGTYTYGEVEMADGRKVWIAGAHIDVKPGDTVQWGKFAVMQNFPAKSLNRTFDQILFVDAWAPAGAPAARVAPHGTLPGAMPAAMPGVPPATAGAPAANNGQVKSAVTAAGYTYLEIAQGSGSVWVAAPETQVKVGDKVSWDGGMVMNNFTAKSLNRTFDSIVFAGGVTVLR